MCDSHDCAIQWQMIIVIIRYHWALSLEWFTKTSEIHFSVKHFIVCNFVGFSFVFSPWINFIRYYVTKKLTEKPSSNNKTKQKKTPSSLLEYNSIWRAKKINFSSQESKNRLLCPPDWALWRHHARGFSVVVHTERPKICQVDWEQMGGRLRQLSRQLDN